MALACLRGSSHPFAADEIQPIVHRIHDSPTHDGEPMIAEDVEQLFSNIDQSDLIEKMGDLVDMCFGFQAEKMGNIVQPQNVRLVVQHKHYGGDPEWVTLGDQRKNSNSTKVLSAEDIKRYVNIAVRNGYLTVGTALFLQTLGIPMGMHASPYLSNLFLFMYEFKFMMQFINAGQQAYQFFKRWFSAIVRYQDDRFAALSRYALRAQSVLKYWGHVDESTVDTRNGSHPWRGIYPTQYLNITLEQSSEDSIQH